MQLRKEAGLALAGLVCVFGLAAWMQSARDGTDPASRAEVAPVSRAPLVALPDGATFKSPQPIRIDAAIARAAVRDGTLRLALPDGREHAIAIERQFTDESGHWNIVGRAPTRVGAQAMVLTFGGNAVFGRIPMPDGNALHVFTAPGDRVVVTPDGGIVPRNAARVIGKTDAVMPDRSRVPQFAGKPTHVAAASTPMQVASPKPDATTAPNATPSPTAQSLVAAAIDTTPVTIDLITLYTPGQVTLRGSASAVQTEIANLIAITNQAHIDSGSRVRMRSVHVRELVIPGTTRNTDVLSSAAYSPGAFGVDLEALRDQYSGDLVSVLRPHYENDGTCGVGYTPGFSYGRTQVYANFAYNVVNVDGDCGTLVHPHELGHNIGSMHDRETDTPINSVTNHGAFVFSSGYRTKTFRTVMAYWDGSAEQQWIARFSNPAKKDCVGAPCGIADYSDNVRSFNLVAPAVAAFRNVPNQLAIADVEVVAPFYAPLTLAVPIRLSGKAGVDGVAVDIAVVGGTATQNVDYTLAVSSIVIPQGEREGYAQITVKPDIVAEGDETIALHIASTNAVSDADAVITLSESDPRVGLWGQLWFPEGTAPTTPVLMQLDGLDGAGSMILRELQPPNFAYSVAVPRGMQVILSTPSLPDPFVLPWRMLNEVRVAHQEHMLVEPGVLVSGTVRAAPGMTPPSDITLSTTESHGPNRRISRTIQVGSATDWKYAARVPRGSFFRVDWEGPFDVPGNTQPFSPTYAYFLDVRDDTTLDLTLSNLPTLVAPMEADFVSPLADTHNQIWLQVRLAGVAPAGGVSFRYRTVDGTAKSGEDYIGISGTMTIAEGSSGGDYLPVIEMHHDGKREAPEFFDLVIDQVAGAQLPKATSRYRIHADLQRTGGPGKKLK